MRKTFSRMRAILKNETYRRVRNRAQMVHGAPGCLEIAGGDVGDIEALIYVGDKTNGSHHIYRQWRRFFKESGISFATLFRGLAGFDAARKEFPSDRFIYARAQADIASLVTTITPTLTVVYHTGNPLNVLDLVNIQHLKHVSIFHGDGEKKANINRMFRLYDELWVAGQAQIDRLSYYSPALECRIVGRPQTRDLLLLGSRELNRQDTPVVTYMPTWEGANGSDNYSSCSIADQITDVVQAAGAFIEIKLHPSTGSRIRSWRQIEEHLKSRMFAGGRLRKRTEDSIDAMKEADICITDTSSIVSDWLVTKRPLFVFVPQAPKSAARIPLSEYAYVFQNIGEFERLFRQVVLAGDDPKKDARRRAADYFVSAEATMHRAFENALVEIADNRRSTTN